MTFKLQLDEYCSLPISVIVIYHARRRSADGVWRMFQSLFLDIDAWFSYHTFCSVWCNCCGWRNEGTNDLIHACIDSQHERGFYKQTTKTTKLRLQPEIPNCGHLIFASRSVCYDSRKIGGNSQKVENLCAWRRLGWCSRWRLCFVSRINKRKKQRVYWLYNNKS